MDTKVIELQREIRDLKRKLQEKELELLSLKQRKICKYSDNLSTDEIVRYSRQIITPELTIKGQELLKQSKILIVGAGGLGCPAALYLASAGIGEITLLDYDEVELTNLHRQILHYESDIGTPKVESAANKLRNLNSDIKIIPLQMSANSESVKQLIKDKKFDVVIDGSDNVATRYLLNDFCVLNNIPLVSGSALQYEGQLTVYNYKNGPCYRCLFPTPPPVETVTNCGDGGVLGPVPGTIGVLQALETIKILTNFRETLSGVLLLFDGASTTFRKVKLRNRSLNCSVCGDNPSVTDLIDYEQFCGSKAHDKVINIEILNDDDQIAVKDFAEVLPNSTAIDVRPELQYKMSHLENTFNFPYDQLIKGKFNSELEKLIQNNEKVYVLCRRGNDSQRTIKYLQKEFSVASTKFINVKGGLQSYSQIVDSDFPIY